MGRLSKADFMVGCKIRTPVCVNRGRKGEPEVVSTGVGTEEWPAWSGMSLCSPKEL
jgi:hypothetical protein